MYVIFPYKSTSRRPRPRTFRDPNCDAKPMSCYNTHLCGGDMLDRALLRFFLAPRFALRAALLISFATGAFAQNPLIYSRSTFNAASFMPAGIPAGAIAQGSIFSVFGAHLGPSTPAGPNGFPLQTTLAGVQLNVIQGATTVQAIPLYVSATQINAIMPSNTPVGTASLQVVYHNARSNMSPVRISSTAMGIFTALGTGL